MKDEIIKLFKTEEISYDLKTIAKKIRLNPTAKKLDELKKVLENLEASGIIYFDGKNYVLLPNNYYIVTIETTRDNKVKYVLNGKEEWIDFVPGMYKGANILVKKARTLVKILPRRESVNEELRKCVKDFFTDREIHYTLKNITKLLNKSDSKDIEKSLRELELEGIIYYDVSVDQYKLFPQGYEVCKIFVDTKGRYYVEKDHERYILTNSEVNGVLPFDTVIKYGPKIIKILKRFNPLVMCEVVSNKKIKIVGNLNVSIRCNSEEFKNLKLPIGTRFLANIGTEEVNHIYDVEFVKVMGYKDELTKELEAIAYNNGFLVYYNEDELEQVYNIPTSVTEKDKENRVDLTKENIFTIDGANTKDMDDAVGVKKLDDETYELTVSIAHVSHYIKYHSPLFYRASKNTTSLYLIDYVLHMLHPQISNGICSLNPLEERLTKTYKMIIDSSGNLKDFQIFDSVIKSKKKMTYEDINKIFKDNIVPSGYEEFVDDLNVMLELTNILDAKRNKNGAINFASKEIKFILDDDRCIEDITTRTQDIAEKIIENFMIVTNESLANYMLNLGMVCVYRNHEAPLEERVKATIDFIKTIGYKVENINNTTNPKTLQIIIDSLSNKEEFFILFALLLRSMKKAFYSTVNLGHYGLASAAYSQVTSPIRRLMDLMIEYILDNINIIFSPSFDFDSFKSELDSLCERASIMERCADKAEYEADKLYMIKYILNNKDKVFTGFVSEITPSYIVVKTDDLIEGYIFINDLDETYTFNPNTKMYENKSNKIKIGTKLSFYLKDCDMEFRNIYFYGSIKREEEMILKRKK